MNPIIQGLLITAIGMGLVFVAILLLWAFMNFLVKITADKKKTIQAVTEPGSTASSESTDSIKSDPSQLQRIAAVAVAVAMGLQKQSPVVRPLDSENISPWQSARRTQVLSQTTALLNRKSRGTTK